ncbi:MULTISPECIES: hypothetical protein [unclassified Cupriavidus]|uniref:hypothetical protein n=1 Tax=unclassified Cupriavidus TaxID=2640874 RepID=UPI0013660D2F|nr:MULTISPECIES: hypothetical protein [unclassified Cupriavidus]
MTTDRKKLAQITLPVAQYLYDHGTNSLPGAPNSVNKLLDNPSFSNAIQKGLTKYLGAK